MTNSKRLTKKHLMLFMMLFSVPVFGQWTTTALSEGKAQMGAVSYGTKVWFGGGGIDTGATSQVEIYDLATEEWSMKQLSIPRLFPAAGAVGGKVFFAGGINFGIFEHYSRVDIFDTLSQTWTTAELSSPKFDVAAVSYGNLLFFAGGVNLITGNDSIIDIYHADTDQWTTATLSQSGAVRAAVSGSKLIFVGAFGSSLMDIYEAATSTWTTKTLPYARLFPAVTAVGDKIIIAGGVNFDNSLTDRVDVYDLITGEWTVAKLSMPRAFINNAAVACGKAFFAGGGNFEIATISWFPIPASNQVDIFDPVTNQWTTDQLNNTAVVQSVLGNGNHVLVTGGADSTGLVSSVQIYTCNLSDVFEGDSNSDSNTPFFINPATDFLYFSDEFAVGAPGTITLTSVTGQVVCFEKLAVSQLNISHLRPGIYFLHLKIGERIQSGKLVKQ
ncbi:MAG: kelch repeat-containing protein [Saprospiraceae bacterium]